MTYTRPIEFVTIAKHLIAIVIFIFREFKLYFYMNNEIEPWVPETSRAEARGMYADSFDSLKPKAFPTLLNQAQMNKTNLLETAAKYVVDAGTNYRPFSTADTYLSNTLSPERAELMENAFGFKGDYMQKITHSVMGHT